MRASGLGLALLAGAAGLPLAAAPADAGKFYLKDRSGVMHFTNVPTDARYKTLPTGRSSFSRVVFSPAPGGGRAGPGSSSAVARRATTADWTEPPRDLGSMITDAARRHGLEPALVHAVVRAESAFDHRAVSPDGAMGLMQLMPDTASLVGVRNAFQPAQNVEGGVSYLRMMLDRFAGSVPLALAAYNAGPGAVENHGGVPPYPETREYLERVLSYRQEYLRRTVDKNRLALATRRAN